MKEVHKPLSNQWDVRVFLKQNDFRNFTQFYCISGELEHTARAKKNPPATEFRQILLVTEVPNDLKNTLLNELLGGT